ncbi:VOC family protein [Parafrigoribacterium humi]|uniref:VOC family protein n=1 Tax=Parafrigoribacterium humi TaxID=3144664 RepID=UPI0032EC98F1
MAIQGVHHTGITVKDLDQSIYFYHDILGFPFDREPSPWFAGPDLAAGVGVPGASLRQVCLRVGEDILELLEYGNPPELNDTPPVQNQLGAMHVGFRVDDVAATKSELEGKGVKFLSDINIVDEGVLAGWRWVYLKDPDGITLEFVEEAYSEADKRPAAIAVYLASRPPQVPLA